MSKRVMCTCGHPRAEHAGAGLRYIRVPGECYHEVIKPHHFCSCREFRDARGLFTPEVQSERRWSQR